MKIEVHNNCSDFNSYRAARVKSMFNIDDGCNFDLTADLPIDDREWRVGLVVGPSGSGKTSIGKRLFGGGSVCNFDDWPNDIPIIDAIAPDSDFNTVTKALAGVGLGSVPSWLRPYHVLSNGEKFRANLARVIASPPGRVVVDEFTSVVDRQIAKVGSAAFAKAWKRTTGQCVLLSCHYDIIDWLEPDWVFDVATGKFDRGCLWRRPTVNLEIYRTNWSYWRLFSPHHYLKVGPMIAAFPYVGFTDGKPVAHIGVTTRPGCKEARAARFVVMPEYQGIGVGVKFLEAVCQLWLDGDNHYGRPMRTTITTSHPGLAVSLRRSPKWRQYATQMHGNNKGKTRKSIRASSAKKSWGSASTGFGGHFRATQGFRYYGEKGAC
jgi:GNAT superfamily N-acetyltransferase